MFHDDNFTRRWIDTGQCGDIDLMRDEHMRFIELMLSNPRHERTRLWRLLIEVTKKRVQNWQSFDSTEIQ